MRYQGGQCCKEKEPPALQGSFVTASRGDRQAMLSDCLRERFRRRAFKTGCRGPNEYCQFRRAVVSQGGTDPCVAEHISAVHIPKSYPALTSGL